MYTLCRSKHVSFSYNLEDRYFCEENTILLYVHVHLTNHYINKCTERTMTTSKFGKKYPPLLFKLSMFLIEYQEVCILIISFLSINYK